MRTLLVTVAAVLLLGGCGLGSSSPEKVARNFWRAVADGEMDEAKKLATPASLRRIERMSSRREFEDVEVESAVIQDERAEVETLLVVGEEGDPVVFTTHLVQTEDGWRVDSKKSWQAMNAAFVEASISDLQEAFRAGAGAIGEAVEEGLEEASEAMRDALDDLGGRQRPPAQP